ncbi:hypothetical protein BDW59DRAFT_170537 [Aspergillus cavernicola]|uniref:C2H2-type domain-containing protein n=1 Tax=Aspergillus cavernicola TaxID=176166 RepID=A0ABR4IP50_9EURO
MEAVRAKAGPELQCMTCQKRFGKKSSLVRHLKICTSPNSNPRQKSCDQCSFAKSKCDLQQPSCRRCTSRNILSPDSQADPDHFGGSLTHTYATPMGIHPMDSLEPDQVLSAVTYDAFSTPDLATTPPQPLTNWEKGFSFTSLMSLFSEDNEPGSLLHPRPILSLDAWRQTVVLSQESRSPLGHHSMEFSFRVLRTWPRMMARNFQNRTTTPLAHCCTIAKMWHGQCEMSAGLVRDTVVREMTYLFQNYRKFDEAELVAALQAIAIYTILLLFPTSDKTPLSVVDMAVLANLQKLINYVGSLGLVLQEETAHVRPVWEAWINITSRPRAVFALYLVHWSLSAYHALPSFNCRELKCMPAPAPKLLWHAKDREEWEPHYNRWLVEWGQNEYLHGEVSELRLGISLDIRFEKWLEETDEFGMLLMALAERAKMDRCKAQTCN